MVCLSVYLVSASDVTPVICTVLVGLAFSDTFSTVERQQIKDDSSSGICSFSLLEFLSNQKNSSGLILNRFVRLAMCVLVKVFDPLRI